MTPDPNSPQVLACRLNEPEAALLAIHLDALGIEARVVGTNSASIYPEAPLNVQVVVRASDWAKAQVALDELRQKQSANK